MCLVSTEPFLMQSQQREELATPANGGLSGKRCAPSCHMEPSFLYLPSFLLCVLSSCMLLHVSVHLMFACLSESNQLLP